jgi:hypothetical protein
MVGEIHRCAVDQDGGDLRVRRAQRLDGVLDGRVFGQLQRE